MLVLFILFRFNFGSYLSKEHSLAINIIYSISAISYIYVIFKSHGMATYGTREFEEKLNINDAKYFFLKYFFRKRWCKKCGVIQWEGIKHCKYCGVCAYDMDHHCPWTSKCAAGGNIYSFWVFTCSTFIYFVFLIYLFVHINSELILEKSGEKKK